MRLPLGTRFPPSGLRCKHPCPYLLAGFSDSVKRNQEIDGEFSSTYHIGEYSNSMAIDNIS